MEEAIGFDKFTAPMQDLISAAAGGRERHLLRLLGPAAVGRAASRPKTRATSSSGRTSPTPAMPTSPRSALRLRRRLPSVSRCTHQSTPFCRAAATIRRNRHPPARVFNPIHYLELPELFMEFISSMTGKSPSTTGAGSEGALTKGPFNALPPIIDLNAALVSFLLTGHAAFITAAGYVGPNVRVDHDVSLFVPGGMVPNVS